MRSTRAALHSHVWLVWNYQIFTHSFINSKIFGKKVIEYKMCVLIFSTTFVGNISHSKKNSPKYY